MTENREAAADRVHGITHSITHVKGESFRIDHLGNPVVMLNGGIALLIASTFNSLCARDLRAAEDYIAGVCHGIQQGAFTGGVVVGHISTGPAAGEGAGADD